MVLKTGVHFSYSQVNSYTYNNFSITLFDTERLLELKGGYKKL